MSNTENELVPERPRLGWLIDGNPETDSIAVMLQNTGKVIELTVPLQHVWRPEDPYGRWWADDTIHFGDDPDQTRYEYKPPRVLLVRDSRGTVVLVGCRAADFHSNHKFGEGRIVANFAVLGGTHLEYEKIQGLRSDIPALAAWTRLSSMSIKRQVSDTNRLQSVEMRLDNATPIRLARTLNLEMKSTWRIDRPNDSVFAYEGVEIFTTVKRARSWGEHLDVHQAILDLVSITAWKPFGISRLSAQRTDDPETSLNGDSMGERWLPVETHRLPAHEPWERTPNFLFPYDEIGPRGIARWLQLRKTYSRVIAPLMNVLRAEDPWGQPSLVQSGIALEALGYLIDTQKNEGKNLNGRKQMNFNSGLKVIADDMETTPIEDFDEWMARANAAFMGAKHPDRNESDSLVQLNTLRDNLLMLRFWIGLQLGAKPKSLNDKLTFDPLANKFVPLN